MDDETRLFLKKIISDAADARLILGIMQRCAPALSQADNEVLSKCYLSLMAETKDYLQINEAGELIGIEDIPVIIAGEGVAKAEELPTKEQKKNTVVRKA